VSGEACSGCDGRCCYDVLVGITGYDAWRIARAHELPFDEIVTIATSVAGGLGAFRLGDGFAALVLPKNPREERACVFLMHFASGERRCGTYASRPYVCRTYPMRLVDDRVALRRDVACAAGAWNRTVARAAAWRRDLLAYDFEWDLYSRTIAAWDASELDGLPAYFDFVFRTFESIDAARTAYDAAAYEALIAAHHAPVSEPERRTLARFFDERERCARRVLDDMLLAASGRST
jgi:Fe-S-cluster containining protein